MTLDIKKVTDFTITGDGSHPAWEKAGWTGLTPVGGGPLRYATRSKVLWSELGIYFLFECEDKRLSCTKTEKYDEIYLEDVVEIFLWPEEKTGLYFEYEISPLGMELPLIIPNNNNTFHGWLPFLDKEDRAIQSAVKIQGGEQKSMAPIEGWTAEFYIPFKLLKGMPNMPPKVGTSWRANMCRIDNDAEPRTFWSWSPETGEDFHDYNNFGTFNFIE